MDRREFVKSSLVGAGAAAGLSSGGLPAAAAEKPQAAAVLKLCSQDSRIPGKSLKEKAENLLK
ncbi:MAG: hypothetical protein WBC59_05010, partial [Phycisphaerae bacterium]